MGDLPEDLKQKVRKLLPEISELDTGKRLMLDVLEEAMMTAVHGVASPRYEHHLHVHHAEMWFRDGYTGLSSFRYICKELNIDPKDIHYFLYIYAHRTQKHNDDIVQKAREMLPHYCELSAGKRILYAKLEDVIITYMRGVAPDHELHLQHREVAMWLFSSNTDGPSFQNICDELYINPEDIRINLRRFKAEHSSLNSR
jgi:hypothetical protein